MDHLDRPNQIAMILQAMNLDADQVNMMALKEYITDLESRQYNRPEQIVTILKTIEENYPGEMSIALESYITELEARQHFTHAEYKTMTSSEYLYWHAVRREREQRARTLKK